MPSDAPQEREPLMMHFFSLPKDATPASMGMSPLVLAQFGIISDACKFMAQQPGGNKASEWAFKVATDLMEQTKGLPEDVRSGAMDAFFVGFISFIMSQNWLHAYRTQQNWPYSPMETFGAYYTVAAKMAHDQIAQGLVQDRDIYLNTLTLEQRTAFEAAEAKIAAQMAQRREEGLLQQKLAGGGDAQNQQAPDPQEAPPKTMFFIEGPASGRFEA